VSRATNSAGNDSRGVRRFIRDVLKENPTVARVEQIQREVSRTQSQNEARAREARERGATTRDTRGRDMREVVTRIVRRDLERR
jgi:hypothetical protein